MADQAEVIEDANAPHAVAAVFDNEIDGKNALERLQRSGFKATWLAVTERGPGDVSANVVHAEGGGTADQIARMFSGQGDESLYKALMDHRVGLAVAKKLSAEIEAGGVVVVAGEPNDLTEAASILESAGGAVQH